MPSSVRAAYTAVSSPTPISSPRKTAPIGPASNHSAPPASQDPRPPDTGTSRSRGHECSRHEQRALAAARLERPPRGGQGGDEEQAEQRCADRAPAARRPAIGPRDRRFPSSRGGDPRRAWRPYRPGRAPAASGSPRRRQRSPIRRAPSDPTAARAAPAATRIAASITIPANWSSAVLTTSRSAISTRPTRTTSTVRVGRLTRVRSPRGIRRGRRFRPGRGSNRAR